MSYPSLGDVFAIGIGLSKGKKDFGLWATVKHDFQSTTPSKVGDYEPTLAHST